jgi:hypothetical protein
MVGGYGVFGEADHDGRDRQSVVEIAVQQRIVAKIEELFEQIDKITK